MIRKIEEGNDYYSLRDIEKIKKDGYDNFIELYHFFDATQFNLVSDIEYTREKIEEMKEYFQMNWNKLFDKLKNEAI